MDNKIATIEVTEEVIKNKIYIVRGQKVMLDFDLAELYGYETRYLNLQVKRNRYKFPDDFMFQLTHDEINKILMLQNVTSSWGGTSMSLCCKTNLTSANDKLFLHLFFLLFVS